MDDLEARHVFAGTLMLLCAEIARKIEDAERAGRAEAEPWGYIIGGVAAQQWSASGDRRPGGVEGVPLARRAAQQPPFTTVAYMERHRLLPGARNSLNILARPERFELPTSWFVAMRSIQLSYGRAAQWRTTDRRDQSGGHCGTSSAPPLRRRAANISTTVRTTRNVHRCVSVRHRNAPVGQPR